MTTTARLVILTGPEDPRRLDQARSGLAPRLDYRLVAERCGGAVSHWVPPASGLHGPRLVRVSRSLGGNLRHALRLVTATDPASAVYSTAGTWGLPVGLVAAVLRRRFIHVVYAHRFYSPRWLRFLRLAAPLLNVTGWICVNSCQARLLRGALGNRAGQIAAIPQGVDSQFYDPARADLSGPAPFVFSVGAEMRNYDLLLAAARSFKASVLLRASSAWMGQARERPGALPANVRLLQQRLSYVELRDLYAGAAVVAVPLHETPQAAGITTILEAMAMARPVVVTRSRGLPDGLVSGENCMIVDPDAAALAGAITALLANPEQSQSIGSAARRFVLGHYRLEDHARRVCDFFASLGVVLSGGSARAE